MPELHTHHPQPGTIPYKLHRPPHHTISHNSCVLPHLTASRVLLSRHPWHASSHYPPHKTQDRHKIPKMRPTPKIQRLVNAELRNKVEALPNPTASSGIQPFAFPKNQLRADLLKRCIFRHQPVAQCIKRGAMQGVCIETGVGCISQRGVLEGFPGRGASRNYVDQPILAVNSTLYAHFAHCT